MIAKVTFGSSGRGLIRYLFGPGQANEHSDQRVITSGLELGGDALAGRNLSSEQIADIGAGLDAAHEEFGTNPKGGHILHVSLSLPPGDRLLSDDQWAQIAHKAMEALGLDGEGRQPAAWVAIGHGTSANGNQHIHLAASLVRVDGSRVNAWQSQRTLSRLCAEIESTYRLTVIEGREGRGMPGLSRAELERTAREQAAEPPRLTLARMVREASVASRDEAEFVRRLRGSGVLLRPRFETGGKEAVVGYSVAVRTRDGAPPIWFGGGKLARDLTLPNLRQFWEVSAADHTSAVVEWSAAKAVAPGRETVVGIPDDWRRAAGAIERAVEKLQEVPVSDLAAWRGVSREAAGLFAAWSSRFERDSPGPMAAAADALARSAQSRPGDPVPSRDAAANFRGVASIVAQSQLSNKSPMAWATLIDQLGRTLRTIGDAHVARGETETARGLVDNSPESLSYCTIGSRRAHHKTWYRVSESPTIAIHCPGTRSLRTTLRVTAEGGQATIAVLDVSDSSEFASIPVAARTLLLAISMGCDCDHEVEDSSPTRWKCLGFTRTNTEHALSWENCWPWCQMGRPLLHRDRCGNGEGRKSRTRR